MKRRIRLLDTLRPCVVAVLAGAVALLSMPINIFGWTARAAKAEAVTSPVENGATAEIFQSADLLSVELTVNYYRKNQDYAGYNMWLWNTTSGGDGKNYKHDFDAQTVEMDGYPGKPWKTLTETINDVDVTSKQAIGVILRQKVGNNEWGWQTSNMYIPGSNIVDNAVTIYLTENTATIFYSAEDVMANKITDAYFDTFGSVKITTSATIGKTSVFKLKDAEDNVYGTLDCSLDGNKEFVGKTSAVITLDDGFKIDFAKQYKVVDEPTGGFDTDVNFISRGVNLYKLYDMKTFDEDYGYVGTLGAEYSKSQTKFTVWSPAATSMTLNIYLDGNTGAKTASYEMEKGEKGTWTYTLSGDQDGKYYTYSINGDTEIVDPYARSGGVNGTRGMILDLDSTDPVGWNDENLHKIPDYGTTANALSKAVIWEAQIRDVTIHESSGVSDAHKGKFLGLTETGTKNASGKATALDYLKELGVTQVHFQPMFDFASVDETGMTTSTYDKAGEYNWGYDPLNYNMPEGSYSTDPADGYKRVNEMKQMIMALHNAGIQVIMDVVYNHVSDAAGSNFEKLMPGYFFRMKDDGSYYSGSGCGNDTASERSMFRKFMVESCAYWMDEYKLDGFRFDLMGLHDIKTMNEIYDTLVVKNPDVIVYGEGWKLYADDWQMSSGLDNSQIATMFNADKMPNIAFFDDIVRDGLKGSVFDATSKGYVSGAFAKDAAVYIAAAGATSAIDNKYYKSLGSDKAAFTVSPVQNINYVSAHDNATLWDKLNGSVRDTADTLKGMNRLAATTVFTGQGVSFILAGEEMQRSKPTEYKNDYDNSAKKYLNDAQYAYAENSYKSPDSVNAINWNDLDTASDMVEFYKALIKIKTTFPQFALQTRGEVRSNLFINDDRLTDGVTTFAVKDPKSDSYAFVMLNATAEEQTVKLPNGEYSVFVKGDKASATEPIDTFKGNSVTLGAYSSAVLTVEFENKQAIELWTGKKAAPVHTERSNGLAVGLGVGIPAAALAAGGAAAFVVLNKKKKGKKAPATEGGAPDNADEPTPEQNDAPAGEPTDAPADTEKSE